MKGSELPGPIEVDHTRGTPEGWYAFANTSRVGAGEYARIESPDLYGPHCMSFYYYLFSSAKFKFTIYLKVNLINLILDEIYKRA